MADFCSHCDYEFDYDLLAIALQMEPGYSENIFCEGCNIRGVYKDEDEKLYLAKINNGEIGLEAVAIEELMLPAA